MLISLKLWNFAPGVLHKEELIPGVFTLHTCQRSIVLSFDSPFRNTPHAPYQLISGGDAYLFLMETICGLKSKLIGENEIVGQFKQAYQAYASQPLKDTKVLHILEKLFKDAKDIRTKYLIGISQKTYASLTRKHLIQRGKADHIVIIGSGALAEDLINQFKKKARVSLCARNTSKVSELASFHDLDIIPWDHRLSLVSKPFIANTIGAQTILFDQTFFKQWSAHSQKMFVDLGSPSTIQTELSPAHGVVRLNDIFEEGAIVEEHKENQIALAKKAMGEITSKRAVLFNQKFMQSPQLFSPQNVSPVRYL